MPRPKRQRPFWLPLWVPFKDGRYFGLARQTNLGWISALLALLFFSMTISYAAERSRLSKSAFVRSSRSNTILVLRILSEAAAVFITATIHSTFELVQWVLISRPDGIRMPQYLALQPSTGPLGLLVLASGGGIPPSQWPFTARLLSLLRLFSELTVPVIGVLVMSKVNIDPIYVPIQNTTQPFLIGMDSFNSSIASQLGVMQDLLFNMNYVDFLSNPFHAVNMAPELQHIEGCNRGLGVTINDSCARHVLIAQEYQNVYATLPFAQHAGSSIVLSQHQQVYSLQYKDNVEVLTLKPDCKSFESGPQQYRLCVADAEGGWLHAAMIPCPADIVRQKGCATTDDWHSSQGFSTAFKASFLLATVTYDRVNGRILSHEIESPAIPTSIASTELLSALEIILNTTAPTLKNTTGINPILGNPTHFFGRMIAAHMYRISELMPLTPEARIKGVNAIQSLLALTLYYCQNGVMSQTILGADQTKLRPRPLDTYKVGVFEKQNPAQATVALAEIQYRIRVGRATLIAYIVISGITLLICFVVLVVGSVLELVKFDAEPTLWPALDFWTQCRVEECKGKVVTAQQRVELAWIYDARELLRAMGGLRVTRRKRKMGGNEGLELPGVGDG